MNTFSCRVIPAGLCLFTSLLTLACSSSKADPRAEAPPKAVVEPDLDATNFKVDHPERFPLTTAVVHKAPPALNVTGVVQPDIVRAVPVVSLASGRVVEIKARLGDAVRKGQLLLRVQSNDVSGAYQTYLKAENDERLARTQLERAQILYEKGAIAKSALEQAEAAEARTPRRTYNTPSKVCAFLGIDKDHPSGESWTSSPPSRASFPTSKSPTRPGSRDYQALRIPSPSRTCPYVWIVCDVYENDLDAVRVGDSADIRLNAYPNRVFKGRIDNILPVLDPSLRTAKVRIRGAKSRPDARIGMFATATFYGKQPETQSAVPASAVLHLHDREWVYLPLGNAHFKRVEVVTGSMLPGKQQEIVSGIKAGDQVVSNALDLQNTVEQ